MLALLVYITWIAVAIWVVKVASDRNRNGIAWVLGGLAFGVFALIAVYLLPSRPRSDSRNSPGL